MSKFKTIHRAGDPFFGLTIRAANCLSKAGCKTKAQVLKAIKSKRLHPDNLPSMGPKRPCCPNYGWKTHVEVCKWAGLPEPRKNNAIRVDHYQVRANWVEVPGLDGRPSAAMSHDLMVKFDMPLMPKNVRAVRINGEWFTSADSIGQVQWDTNWDRMKEGI